MNSHGAIRDPVGVWHNPTPRDTGFRITTAANRTLVQSGVAGYTFKLESSLSNRDLVDLAAYIRYPYYIETLKKIIIYCEQDVIMLNLYGGDIRAYLAALKSA